MRFHFRCPSVPRASTSWCERNGWRLGYQTVGPRDDILAAVPPSLEGPRLSPVVPSPWTGGRPVYVGWAWILALENLQGDDFLPAELGKSQATRQCPWLPAAVYPQCPSLVILKYPEMFTNEVPGGSSPGRPGELGTSKRVLWYQPWWFLRLPAPQWVFWSRGKGRVGGNSSALKPREYKAQTHEPWAITALNKTACTGSPALSKVGPSRVSVKLPGPDLNTVICLCL